MAANYTQPINIGNPVEHTIEGELRVKLKIMPNIDRMKKYSTQNISICITFRICGDNP